MKKLIDNSKPESLTFVMIVVCGTETLARQYADPRTPFPCPVSPNADRVGAMDKENGDRVPQRQFKFSNPFASPLNPLTPHSATQWGKECSGVNAVP